MPAGRDFFGAVAHMHTDDIAFAYCATSMFFYIIPFLVISDKNLLRDELNIQ